MVASNFGIDCTRADVVDVEKKSDEENIWTTSLLNRDVERFPVGDDALTVPRGSGDSG